MQDINFPVIGPGFLNFEEADPMLRDGAMLWIGQPVKIYENDRLLEYPEIIDIRASLPSNRSFRTYEGALEQISKPPLPNEVQLVWEQAMLDIHFQYPIQSEDSEFSIDPGLERLASRVMTVLKFLPAGGEERVLMYTGDPGLVTLDPKWHQATVQFIKSGFEHILGGLDHLLFILCLVIPFRRFRELIGVVTSFTIAHSITLIASAYGFVPDALWFPPFVEMLIALSIIYMAAENIIGAQLQRRWVVTFGLGLIHGFGFSFALSESLQFAGSHLVLALLSFNVGVELGQILVLIILIPLLDFLFRTVVKENIGSILISAIVLHTSWHWFTTRLEILNEYAVDWGNLIGQSLLNPIGALALVLMAAMSVRFAVYRNKSQIS
tara:strand:- start:17375 stop:18517 length:1143 start_codon:yes stop_codon:yes gene_type:complete